MTKFDDISSPIETRIATGFARIATVMRSQAWERASANGVTPTQSDILALLATRSMALRLSTIAEQLAITPATASDAVSSLVAKGLVEKARAVDDGRALALILSAAGKKMLQGLSVEEGILGEALKSLNKDDQTCLLVLMNKIIRTMQSQNDVAMARMCVTCRYFEAHKAPDKASPHYCHLIRSPFGNTHLRLDCPEHELQENTHLLEKNWKIFLAA